MTRRARNALLLATLLVAAPALAHRLSPAFFGFTETAPDAFDVQWKVHEAYHKHPYIQKEMSKWNAIYYTSNLLPQYEFIGRGKPPKTLADWKGMRVRAIGGIGDAMRNLGAVPTSVDATEVYTSLERGAVDAVSFPSTYAHGSYKTYEIGKWFTANLAPGTQAHQLR